MSANRSQADQAKSTLIKLIVFTTVMAVILSGLLLVFSKYRSRSTNEYHAMFENVSGLQKGDTVRIAGVEVGNVDDVELVGGNLANVSFGVIEAQELETTSIASVRYENLTGDRYLELSRGAQNGSTLERGATLPISQTRPALDLDALLGGFKPLFDALDPGQVNALSESIIKVLQGESSNVRQLLSSTSSLTNSLADRDELIGQVVENLNVVLGTVADRSGEFDSILVNLQELISGLAADSAPIGESIEALNGASDTLTNLLVNARPSLKADIEQIDRVSTLINNDEAYVESVLQRLPQDFQRMARLGAYGGFFNFYLCGVFVKFNDPTNGKITYPVNYEQRTGRCSP